MSPKKDKTEDSDLAVTKALKNLQDEISRMNDTMQTVRSEVTSIRDDVIKNMHLHRDSNPGPWNTVPML